MKKILLLAPRLDVNFKHNPGIKTLPKHVGSVLPGKELWANFRQMFENEYRSRLDTEVSVLELALWQFIPEVLKDLDYDSVFVPHKEHHNFTIKNKQVYYYMQTTFPWIFSIDPKGWAAGASVYPYSTLLTESTNSTVFNFLKDRALSNQSKFDQPNYKDVKLPEDFLLFACQIPHDETIKFHSSIGVGKALIYTCEATKDLGIPLVVKGHPMNPTSMIGLKNSLVNYKHVTWIDNVSIHQLISLSKGVVVVNSGVGMETLLHGKPVVTFGRAEYDCVTNHATKDNIKDILQNLVYDKSKVIDFFHAWYNWAYDTSHADSFKKLP